MPLTLAPGPDVKRRPPPAAAAAAAAVAAGALGALVIGAGAIAVGARDDGERAAGPGEGDVAGLRIESTPARAFVEIDGQDTLQTTPAVFVGLTDDPARERVVRLTLKGHRPVVARVGGSAPNAAVDDDGALSLTLAPVIASTWDHERRETFRRAKAFLDARKLAEFAGRTDADALAPTRRAPPLESAWASAEAGQRKHAQAQLTWALESLAPSDALAHREAFAALAGIACLDDELPEARSFYDRAERLGGDDDALLLYAAAGVHALLGDADGALDRLELATDGAGGAFLLAFLVEDRDLRSLDAHPRFEALVARAALLPPAAPSSSAAAAVDVIQTFASGKINWTRQEIVAEGTAAANLKDATVAQARMLAERGAKVDALAKLVATLRELRIDGARRAGDAFADDDELERKLKLLAQGFKIVDTRYYSDGSVDVVAALGTDAELARMLLPPAPPAATVARTEGRLIVDARQLTALQPALAPRIVDESGRELCGAGAGVGERGRAECGSVGYVAGVDAARERLGTQGVVTVSALGLAPGSVSDVVVSEADAARMRAIAPALSAGRVVFVVDARAIASAR